MANLAMLLILVLALLLGYGMHTLIRKFINPKTSVNHLFLYFLAHFIGTFMLVFLVGLLVTKYARFLFQA